MSWFFELTTAQLRINTGIQYEGTLADAIHIDQSQNQDNVELFGGTIDVNPNRSVWTKNGWKNDGGEQVQDTVNFDTGTTADMNLVPLADVSAYSENKKMFELACNLARTESQRAELRLLMSYVHYRMRASANDAEVHSDDCKDGDNGSNEHCTTTDDLGMKETAKITKHGLMSFTAISNQVKRMSNKILNTVQF